VIGEKWWPVKWPAEDGNDIIAEVALTHWHPTVKRVMRDAGGMVIEFHARLGRPPLDLGKIDELELRCALLELASQWWNEQDGGKRE
jgi:hypothetical protein